MSMTIDIGNGIVLRAPASWIERMVAPSPDRWMTWGNVIFPSTQFWYEASQFPIEELLVRWKHIIEHEKTHVMQHRKTGTYWWYFKYITMPKFRLSQEVEAVIAEIMATNPDFATVSNIIEAYADDLSSKSYYWCATKSQALSALWLAYKQT